MNKPYAPADKDNAAAPASSNWSLLFYLNIYRVVLASLLVTATIVTQAFDRFGFRLPLLSAACAAIFGVVCAINFFTIAKGKPRFSIQANYQITLDIVLLVLLIHASTGINSAVVILLVVAIAASAVLLPARMALFHSALATVLVLAQQTYAYIAGQAPITGFSKVGVLGFGLFVTALVIKTVARRIEVTERLVAERETRILNLDQINRAVVDLLDVGVLFIEENDAVRVLNERGAVLLGVSTDALPPAGDLRTLSPRLLNIVSSARRDHPSSKLAFQMRQNGRVLAVSLHPAGKNWLAFLEDFSDTRKRTEQAKLAALGRMAAAIAHEIRNPLSAIGHAQQLLEESDLRGDDASLLGMIGEQTKRIDRVITSILSLSRPTGEAQTIPLRTWLEKFCNASFAARHLPPDAISVEGRDVAVRMNPNHLDQVMTNLVDNALRYSSDYNGVPLVICSVGEKIDGSAPGLDIVNQGDPIAREHEERLFEPFFTSAPGGTGLGLYIARQLCEANNATLEHIPDGNGTRFRIVFAAAD